MHATREEVKNLMDWSSWAKTVQDANLEINARLLGIVGILMDKGIATDKEIDMAVIRARQMLDQKFAEKQAALERELKENDPAMSEVVNLLRAIAEQEGQ